MSQGYLILAGEAAMRVSAYPDRIRILVNQITVSCGSVETFGMYLVK